jgi:putative ABC transport system permease protein
MRLAATFRSLARAPGLAVGVVLTLALGVAALTTAFGIVHAGLWRQPPFPDASRIAMLFLHRNPRGEPPQQERWSFGRFELLRKAQRSFEVVASYSPASLSISGDGDAELVQGERVSAAYFQLLRVGAARGRLFTEAEDDPAAPTPVVVLGHGLWTRRWAADPSIIGRTIRLNGVPLTVIGVLPPEFAGLSGRAQLWIPRTMSPQITYPEYLTTNQNFISAVGRLRPGVDLPTARSELAVLGASINRALPSDPDFPDEKVNATAATLNEARANQAVRRSLFVLLAGVTVLHLLACANVANLLLGRALARRRESAVRLALGSSNPRLFGHIFREGVVIALLGGLVGIALAAWLSSLIVAPANVWAPRNFYGSLASFDSPSFDLAELFFGIGLTLVTALLVATPAATSVFRLNLAAGVKAGSRGIAEGAMSLRRPSLRGIIVGIEAAFAMMLVVSAALLIDSFERMRRASIGVEPAHILTFWVIPSEAQVPPAAAPAFVSRLLDELRKVPGVVSASVDGGAPLAGTASSVLYIEGRPMPAPGQAPPVLRHYIAPEHFATLGIPILRGRAFTDADVAGSRRVAVISETAARRFWPDEDPLGKRVWFGGGSSFDSPDSSAEIVGIVGDVVYAPLDLRPNFSSFYTPYAQFTYAARAVFLRTAGDPWSVVPEVRKAVAIVNPDLALQDVQPLTDIVKDSWGRNRFEAILFSACGIAALMLAASGIFAVLAYLVADRTREFGIRIALGATPRHVLWQVLREGMTFPLVGLIIGVGLSLVTTRLLQSSLYEISPQEPRLFVGTALLLVLVSAAACLIPGWRATRADPVQALSAE